MPTFVTTDGTSLFYRDWGQGAPLVFLAGLGLGSQMWDYQFAALAEQGFRCIGLDRRGHGRSDQPARGYNPDTLSDDIAALIRTLDLTGVTLISHSMAGGEIVRYLTRHGQEHIARVILLAPTPPRLLQGPDHPEGLPLAQFEALWGQWRRDYPQWVADNVAPFFVPETSRAMMHWAASLLTTPLPILLACNRAMLNADFRKEMQQITVPSLIIHGDRDRSIPLELGGRSCATLLRGSRLLVYEGAPHGLMFTHMDRLHADMLQFIRAT
jgi:pimeloyl-ACP methyl ester carboxylesterase